MCFHVVFVLFTYKSSFKIHKISDNNYNLLCIYVCMYIMYVCMSKKRLPPIKFHSHLAFST